MKFEPAQFMIGSWTQVHYLCPLQFILDHYVRYSSVWAKVHHSCTLTSIETISWWTQVHRVTMVYYNFHLKLIIVFQMYNIVVGDSRVRNTHAGSHTISLGGCRMRDVLRIVNSFRNYWRDDNLNVYLCFGVLDCVERITMQNRTETICYMFCQQRKRLD